MILRQSRLDQARLLLAARSLETSEVFLRLPRARKCDKIIPLRLA